MHIYTIGYEGADIDAFIQTLERVGVRHVLDVRDFPASRRRAFSKNILREHLAACDIGYSHLKALGDPKEGRDAMRRGDKETFLAIFQERLRSEPAQAALREAVATAEKVSSVLLCYERDPKSCHRSIVAQAMKDNRVFAVQHLGVQSLHQGSTARARSIEYQPTC